MRPDNRLRLILFLVLFAAALGALHAWGARYTTNPDGISYLDIASAWSRTGDWSVFPNGLWSPLYPFLIGLALKIVPVGPQYEIQLVHAVNYLCFLLGLASFHLLLREIVKRRPEDGVPEWCLLVIGYTLYLYAALEMVTLALMTPDMLTMSMALLEVALLLRVVDQPRSLLRFAVLGIGLGIGYMAKAILFPVGIVVLALSFFARGRRSSALAKTALAGALFLAVSAPHLYGLRQLVGHWGIGEAGHTNVLHFNGGIPWTPWAGALIRRIYNPPVMMDRPPMELFKAPMKRIHEYPDAYYFGGRLHGSYEAWSDGSYWIRDVQRKFSLRNALIMSSRGAAFYVRQLVIGLGALLAAVVVFLGWQWRSAAGGLARQWPLLIPALAGMSAFLLVHVESRYVAGFVILLWVALLAAGRVPQTEAGANVSALLTAGAVLSLGAGILFATTGVLIPALQPNRNWEGARELHNLGLPEEAAVAVIGEGFESAWARLARVHIQAEVPPDEVLSFWGGPAEKRAETMAAIEREGLRYVVALPGTIPSWADSSGWRKAGDTGYFLYMFPAR